MAPAISAAVAMRRNLMEMDLVERLALFRVARALRRMWVARVEPLKLTRRRYETLGRNGNL